MSPPSMEEVKTNKVQSIMDEIKLEIAKDRVAKNIPFILQLADELNSNNPDLDVTTTEVAAAFLNVSMRKIVTGSSPKLSVSDLEVQADRKPNTDKGYSRLFINLGNKDKLESSQLVKLLASNTSVKGKDIGKIDMLDKFSFLEVPGKYVDEIIHVLTK